MKISSEQLWLLFRGKLRFLPAFILLALIVLSFSTAKPALADGGGLPTLTPSVTPTTVVIIIVPTATPEPTGAGVIFPSTNTPTTSALGLSENQTLGEQPIPMVRVATEPASSTGRSLLSCWPIGLVVLLLAIAGIYGLSVRARQTP